MKDTMADCRRTHLFSRFTIAFLIVLPLVLAVPGTASDLDHSKGIQFQSPPLRFEVNKGQTDPQVRFTARDRGGISFLTPGGAVLQITKTVEKFDVRAGLKKAAHNPEARMLESSFVRLNTIGANPNPRIVGLEPLPGVTNYFIGNDSRKWRTNVAGYAKVRYEGIYPGIDLVYYGNEEGRIEYDFVVAPGADPNQVVVSVEGAQKIERDSAGGLVISAATGKIRQPAPRIYQEINGKRQEIAGGYRMVEVKESTDRQGPAIGNHLLAFAINEYDVTRPLVIDPEIIYATYLGGSSATTVANEGARSVAVDAQGSVYVLWVTVSADFPTKNPAQGVLQGFSNAFITKLDANGQLVYSTYLGGSGFDEGAVIKVDETGAVYVGGTTGSADFPTVNPALGRGGRNDGFITKLSPFGSQIVYSTYLGGTDNDSVADLALDDQKNVFAVGNIAPVLGAPANDFPVVNPIQATHGGGFRDGFMSIISSTGSSLLFSTYLGGDGDDYFQSVVLDPNNVNVYLGFYKDSTNFPLGNSPMTVQGSGPNTPNSAILRLRWEKGFPEGGFPVFSGEDSIAEVEELIGGSASKDVKVQQNRESFAHEIYEGVSDLNPGTSSQSVTSSGEVVQTRSGGGLDAKLTVLNQNLNVTNTAFFGGSGEDTISALAVDAQGAAYVTDRTRSTDLPTVNPIQANHSGGDAFEGFLAVFAPETLEPVFATYLGGIGMESLTGVTVDAQGNIYVVGETFGNFPTATPGAIQDQLSGRTDAFIIKISPAIAGVQQPTLTLTLNQSAYSTGNPLDVDLTFANPGASLFLDVYFGVLLPASAGPAVGCPSGDGVIFFANGLTTPVLACASAPLQGFPRTFEGLSIPAGLPTVTIQSFFGLVWPQGAPAGVYQVFKLLTQANALSDGAINPGDVVTFSAAPATFSP